jgi:hypothetical protein
LTGLGLNQIPFGLRESDGTIIDVHAVPRGRGCGCICPSCRTPLIARQGGEKVWHFAHASRAVFDRTAQECDFSFYVSIRLMARQLIGSELTLVLPDYRGCVSRYVPALDKECRSEYLVTKGCAIQLERVQVETRFADVAVDLKGWVGDFEFVVYLIHPGREVPPELRTLEGVRAGVVAIDLRGLLTVFSKAVTGESTYSGTLAEFLRNDLGSKRWIYHPRQAEWRKAAEAKLEASIAEEIEAMRQHLGLRSGHDAQVASAAGNRVKKTARLVRCECQMCLNQWDGHEPGLNTCPTCRTHLYTRILGAVPVLPAADA